MRQDTARLRQALSGTSLAGRAVHVVEVPGNTSVGLEAAGRAGELPKAWEEARALVDETGRWPLAVQTIGADTYSRWLHRSDEETPDVVLTRASGMTMGEAMQGRYQPEVSDRTRLEWPRIVAYSIEETERRIGMAPTPDDVRAAVPSPSPLALEDYLFEWEEARRQTAYPACPEAQLHDPSYVYDDPFRIAFLPTADGTSVPAYTNFWTCQSFGHERLVAALRHWKQQYDAEPVANTGTIMCLRVGRPPRTIEDAIQAALELSCFSDPSPGSEEHESTDALQH